MTFVPIPLPPHVLMAIGLLLALLALSGLVILMLMPKEVTKREALSTVQSRMGLRIMHPAAFVLGALFWGVLFGLLIIGLIWTIFGLIWGLIPQQGQTEAIWNWRFSLVKLTALTTVLAAVIALPFTLIRLELTRDQIRHATDSLYNDKMNAAFADLYAQRQVTNWTKDTAENGWEDDVVRRTGAIDRLLHLALTNPDSAPRVIRIFANYATEISRTNVPPIEQRYSTIEDLADWLEKLPLLRYDIVASLRAIGELPRLLGQIEITQGLDLREVNIQQGRLSELSLFGVDLRWSKAQKTRAIATDLRKANLRWANFDGAFLDKADLRCSELKGISIGSASLVKTDLRGTHFQRVQMDSQTSLDQAKLRGAAFQQCTLNVDRLGRANLLDVFCDGSVSFVNKQGNVSKTDIWQDRWREDVLSEADFHTAWRAFQRSIGQDPDDPK
ncbi:pentapeptide repeat-containing protein [Sulfitobacter porphyrae]|uniref:Pentapeptide repeat-containing protein n=1 Tax=Sulfitobacter porphyrae TaxID=1246864 RepID=A0ABW2B554_9RHOB|nr:hypothetical protein GCM10007928_01340 [Sulfitobacter porphyrae]